MEPTGTSYVASTHDTSLERMVRSRAEVGDTPGLTTMLQEILVFDPLQRPSVPDILDHPGLVGSSNPAIPPGSASE